ncbi:MAG: hypothetical protein HUJ31_19880, partial [Pseudomonadales bacterium]|nr:hypothetical protein [Pseudomonadales bacterium]
AALALTIALAFKLVIFAVVGLLPGLWTVPGYFEGFIIVVSLTSQVVTVAIIALFMNICSQKVAATQFAVYMASANLALSAGSGLVAPLDARMDAGEMYLVAAAMNGLFLLLWPLFNLERHQERLLALDH